MLSGMSSLYTTTSSSTGFTYFTNHSPPLHARVPSGCSAGPHTQVARTDIQYLDDMRDDFHTSKLTPSGDLLSPQRAIIMALISAKCCAWHTKAEATT